MTVRELMGLLTQHNPDMPVLVEGPESGFDVPTVSKTRAVRPAHPELRRPWQGRYARHLEEDGLVFEAVVIALGSYEPKGEKP
jgi:hypothetical protein